MPLVRPVCCRRSLARVCRRWRQLVDSPELLRSVSVQLEATDPHDRSCSSDEDGSDSEGGGWFDGCSDDPEAPIRHILGFFDWLEQRAAPHVERLTVDLGRLAFVLDFQMGCEDSVTSALCHALKACTRLQVGGLQRLGVCNLGRHALSLVSTVHLRLVRTGLLAPPGPCHASASALLFLPSA